MKNSHWPLTSALCLVIWLLGTASGHCFFNSKQKVDELPVTSDARAPAHRACERPVVGVRSTDAADKPSGSPLTRKCLAHRGDVLYYGYRYYNASTGRWLSRDPLGDTAFIGSQIAANPEALEVLTTESLRPTYCFTRNVPLSYIDKTGLDADVTWNPAPSSCGKGESIAFVQVGYGGWGPYSQPFVDDGSKGFGASGTGCPEYPNFGRPGNFEDTPGGMTGHVKFITCEVCTHPCCTRRGPGTEMRIVACKAWKKGDTGSLGQSGAFRDATAGERTMLENALSAKYPDWRGCYKYTCTHKAS